MAIRRAHRRVERTPEEQTELRAAREEFQREKPGLDDLAASGKYEGPFRHGDVMAFLSAVARLKHERERRGLTLAEVSSRSGLDQGMLSRLENGKILNPTLTTLWRYAEAVGAQIGWNVEPVPAGAGGEAR